MPASRNEFQKGSRFETSRPTRNQIFFKLPEGSQYRLSNTCCFYRQTVSSQDVFQRWNCICSKTTLKRPPFKDPFHHYKPSFLHSRMIPSWARARAPHLTLRLHKPRFHMFLSQKKEDGNRVQTDSAKDPFSRSRQPLGPTLLEVRK